MPILQNYSLLKHNTFGIDVNAKYFVEFASTDELKTILKEDIIKNNQLLVIGQGSNLLFINDFDGVILHSNIQGIETLEETDEEVILEVGSGVVVDDLIAYCVENNWAGIENLSLIPGEVGAAAIQNIGAYGVEIKDVIQQVKTINIEDGSEKVFELPDCGYAYRKSVFKDQAKGKFIVCALVIKLSKLPNYTLTYQHLEKAISEKGEINLENIRQTIIEVRESKLPNPQQIGNAGSFFMNPVVTRAKFDELQKSYPTMPHYFVNENEEKVPAAWLIEQCGWKGKTVGNAGVYEKQALVLVNRGGATGQEIADLSAQIQQSVMDKFGIQLNPEVNFIS